MTKSLESAVRKISRGSSPNIGPGAANQLSPEIYSGLSGLAKGYEQYRESLTFLRPTTEFGEPSSDDLSSEWDENANETSEGEGTITVVNLTESLANALAFNAVRRRQFESSKVEENNNNEAETEEEDEEIVEKNINIASVESQSCKKAHKRVSDS